MLTVPVAPENILINQCYFDLPRYMRLKIDQSLLREVCNDLRLSYPPEIRFASPKPPTITSSGEVCRVFGVFNHFDKSIVLYDWMEDLAAMEVTLLHELRHAYQKHTWSWLRWTLNNWRSQTILSQSPRLYNETPMEADANRFAEENTRGYRGLICLGP